MATDLSLHKSIEVPYVLLFDRKPQRHHKFLGFEAEGQRPRQKTTVVHLSSMGPERSHDLLSCGMYCAQKGRVAGWCRKNAFREHAFHSQKKHGYVLEHTISRLRHHVLIILGPQCIMTAKLQAQQRVLAGTLIDETPQTIRWSIWYSKIIPRVASNA